MIFTQLLMVGKAMCISDINLGFLHVDSQQGFYSFAGADMLQSKGR
jgi:hypothetical protein